MTNLHALTRNKGASGSPRGPKSVVFVPHPKASPPVAAGVRRSPVADELPVSSGPVRGAGGRLTRTATAALIALSICALLASGCSKKAEPEAAKAAARAQAAKAPAPPPAPKEPPPPADVDLQAGDAVVAWLSLRSLTTIFDATETVASKLGALPPGASLREKAYNDLTLLLANNGVTGHEWLDKARPLHVIFQDDDPKNPQGGAALMLPVTAEKAAIGAMKAAKTGAEAKGHAVLLLIEGKPTFFDFVDKYMVVTTDEARFGKVKAFAGRLAKADPGALVYLGVSITDVVKTRKAEIDVLVAQLSAVQQQQAAKGMPGSEYYNRMIQQWLSELTRFEVTLDADAERFDIGTRMHAVKDSKLYKQFNAGRGRDALELAKFLPANAYLAAVASTDPKASEGQVEESLKMLQEMFKLDDKATAALRADVNTAMKFADGSSAFAAYPDGSAALGMVAFAGARDPAAVLKVTKRVISAILLRALEMEQDKAKKLNPKAADDPKLAIVAAAVKDMQVDPLIQSFGPIAKEMGVTITANTSKDGGAVCDVIDLAFDWAKIGKAAPDDAARGAAIMGDRTALTMCVGKERLSFAAGPSALEQGRRAALAKPAGLADAPVFRGAAARNVKKPTWLFMANTGTAIAAFGKVLPMPVTGFPTDRAVTVGCGNRARSFACQIEVPVQVIQAVRALTSGTP